MAKNARRLTFADLIKEPTWSQTKACEGGQYAARPGRFNGAGEFSSIRPGTGCYSVRRTFSVEAAQRLVDTGALVVA